MFNTCGKLVFYFAEPDYDCTGFFMYPAFIAGGIFCCVALLCVQKLTELQILCCRQMNIELPVLTAWSRLTGRC